MLIGYARVSTPDHKPHLPLDALREAGCDRIFEETASGAECDRPELAPALNFLCGDDSLVVWKLDRLARSTRQRLGTGETLKRRGVGLKILTQNMGTTCVDGRFIFTASSAIAEFEREIIRERTRAALDAARPRGSRCPCAVSAKDLKEARALLTDPGLTVVDVARRLGVSPSTLYRDLPAAQHSAQGIER